MSGHWYVGDAAGSRFNWAKEPAFRCPLAELALERPGDFEPAAELLDLTGERLARIFERAHARGFGYRRRVDDRLTDECQQCGHKMRRLGFRAWIDEPGSWGGHSDATRALNEALGNGPPRRLVRETWHKTKKEAEAWARHECSRAKAAA